jgi:hypothetical protein
MFLYPPRPVLGKSIYNGYQISFQGAKRQRRGVKHPPPFSAEVKEKVERHFYSSSVSSWQVIGLNLPLPLYLPLYLPLPLRFKEVGKATACGDKRGRAI